MVLCYSNIHRTQNLNGEWYGLLLCLSATCLAFVVQAQSCFNVIFETHAASGGFGSFRIV